MRWEIALLSLGIIAATEIHAAPPKPGYAVSHCSGSSCRPAPGWVACWLDYTEHKDNGDSGTDDTTYNEMQMWTVGKEHACPNDASKRCYPYVWTAQGMGSLVHTDKSGTLINSVRVDSSGTGDLVLVTRNASERFDRNQVYLMNQVNNGRTEINGRPQTNKPPYFEWPIGDIPAAAYKSLWHIPVNAGSSGGLASPTAMASCNAFFTRK